MTIRKELIRFSDCDDNIPQGEYTGYEGGDADALRVFAKNTFTIGDYYVAFDNTGKSKETGQGPYYLYNLGGE